MTPQSTFASVSPKLQDIWPCAFGTLSRSPSAIYRRIKFCHISTGNVDMMVWNQKYILGNQRKAICPIVNFMITSNKHFHQLLSYFMGTWPESAVGMVYWCQYSPEIQYGEQIDYENGQQLKVWNCGTKKFYTHLQYVGFHRAGLTLRGPRPKYFEGPITQVVQTSLSCCRATRATCCIKQCSHCSNWTELNWTMMLS